MPPSPSSAALQLANLGLDQDLTGNGLSKKASLLEERRVVVTEHTAGRLHKGWASGSPGSLTVSLSLSVSFSL
jgi:hypothetical protein